MVLKLSLPPVAPLHERIETAARQLHGKLEAGNLRRLPICELVEIRNLVMMLEACAVEARTLEPPPPALVAHKPFLPWYRRWRA